MIHLSHSLEGITKSTYLQSDEFTQLLSLCGKYPRNVLNSEFNKLFLICVLCYAQQPHMARGSAQDGTRLECGFVSSAGDRRH